MKKFVKSFLCTSGAALMMAMPVLAQEPTEEIEPDAVGSITLQKLKSEDAKHQPGTLVGGQDLSNVGQEGIANVTYSYKKIGDLVQVADATASGGATASSVGLYYTLDQGFLDTLASFGVTPVATHLNGDADTDYYTSDAVNDALHEMNTHEQGYGDDIDGTQAGNEVMTAWVSENGTAMTPTDGSGTTTAENLEQGLYVIVESDLPDVIDDGETPMVAKAIAPFLMAIPTTNIAQIGDNPAGTVWQYDLFAYPKNETISIRKDIVATDNDLADGASSNGLVQQTDKNVGDTIHFLLTADVPALQPQIDAEANSNRKYVITDYMTQGLQIDDFSGENFVVKYGDAAYNAEEGLTTLEYGVDYTVEEVKSVALDDGNHAQMTGSGETTGRGFVLKMTEAGLAKFDVLTQDVKLYVEYDARVTAYAANPSDPDGIKPDFNDYKLTYGTSTSRDMEIYSNKDVTTYNYEVNITKEFSNPVDDMTMVTFTIENTSDEDAAEELEFIKDGEGDYHLWDGKEAGDRVKEVSVDETGHLSLRGLDDGEYTIHEVSTASGYNLMRDPIVLTLSKAPAEDGTLDHATIKNGDEEIEMTDGLDKGMVNFKIINNETISVLHTGGEGWGNGMALIGTCAMLVGGALIISKKRVNA